MGNLRSIPADFGREAEDTLGRLSISCRANTKSHGHLLTIRVASWTNLHVFRLWEETRTGTTCKLCTERRQSAGRFEPRKFLLWGDGANYYDIVPPNLWIMLFKRVHLQGAVIWLWKNNWQNKSRIIVRYQKGLEKRKRNWERIFYFRSIKTNFYFLL